MQAQPSGALRDPKCDEGEGHNHEGRHVGHVRMTGTALKQRRQLGQRDVDSGAEKEDAAVLTARIVEGAGR